MLNINIFCAYTVTRHVVFNFQYCIICDKKYLLLKVQVQILLLTSSADVLLQFLYNSRLTMSLLI